jgi:hypothetical protein
MWNLLAEILLLICTAFVLGALAQRLKQSPILGYLMAGTIIGPLLFNSRAVFDVAELGVALLLFSIGRQYFCGCLWCWPSKLSSSISSAARLEWGPVWHWQRDSLWLRSVSSLLSWPMRPNRVG